MKRLFAAALAAIASLAFGATTVPVQLLSPAGSIASQVITSTGPSSPPSWASLGTAAAYNTGTSGANVPLLSNANTWAAAQTFSVRPTFNGQTPYDTGNLTIANYQTRAGVTDGSDAAAGQIGEFKTNASSGTSLTTGVAANCASVSLTAGDWDVSGIVRLNLQPTTTLSSVLAGINTTSATNPGYTQYQQINASLTTGAQQIMQAPLTRVSVSATTTVYLIGTAIFGTSTATCDGFIRARRAPH